MSDVMLFGVLQMPYELAMSDEFSRLQFYQRVQELIGKYEKLVAELDDVKGELQTVKHMNKNWAISEGWALQEIEKLKAELDKQGEPVAWAYKTEEIYDDLSMSWQADMENGVKCLNEKAVDDFKENYPELNKSISRTMQFLREITDTEYTAPQTKPLSDEEILQLSEYYCLADTTTYEFSDSGLVNFVKALLERNGIK